MTNQHNHSYTKIAGEPIVPKSSEDRSRADDLRRLKRGSSDNGQFQPYDYESDDRIIITATCECGKSTSVDLLHRAEAVELFKKMSNKNLTAK